MNTTKFILENFWGITEKEFNILETTGNFDTGGHWNLYKIGTEYEAIYDGLYMHVFSNATDFLLRENEIGAFEYDVKASREADEEIYLDEHGNKRTDFIDFIKSPQRPAHLSA